jgi:nucleoside-diphosphate-sugar epimerase
MKLFVTGGTGFVGSHFLRQALAAGHEVHALRRPGSRPRVNLEVQPNWIEIPFEALESKDFYGIDAVVHLAAHSANVPYDTLGNCLHWNVSVPLRMAEQSSNAGVERYVVAGSCFEYGGAGERYEFIPPDAPLEPTQSYPISKASASVAWAGFGREKHARVSILRMFQVYGEGEAEGRLWPSLRAAALAGRDFPMTKGEQVRDFIEVGEVARQFLAVTAADNEAGRPVITNVGSGRPQTIEMFAGHWWKQWGARGRLQLGAVPYRPNEVMRYVPQLTGACHSNGL